MLDAALSFHVVRDGVEWALVDDRDVEELGGVPSVNREHVYVTVDNSGSGAAVRAPLRHFPLPREFMPCSGSAPDVLTVKEGSVEPNGAKLLQALRTTGYFKVRMTRETTAIVQRVYASMTAFFEQCTPEQKQRYAGATRQQFAPSYGYRATSVSVGSMIHTAVQMP